MISYIFYNLTFLGHALPYVLAFIPIVIIFRFLCNYYHKKQQRFTTKWHEIGVICFASAIIFIASLTFLPYVMLIPDAPYLYIYGYGKINPENINIIPFQVFQDFYAEVIRKGNLAYLASNIVGNIICFMPIGFFVPLLWNHTKFYKTVIYAALFSVFIEINQLPLNRGVDIDDVWINTFGAILGYLIFLLFQKLFPSFTKKFRMTVKNSKMNAAK